MPLEVKRLEANPNATDGDDAAEARARRRGRRWTMTAYYVVVAVFIVIAAGNVVWQVWAPAFRKYPPVDCRAGLRDLTLALDRARDAAGSLAEAGEDTALSHFRSELSPEWDRHDAVAASCRKDRELAVALDVIERLRYAEERAVRREVDDLAPLRRRVGQIRTNELSR
jgi:hypothetical protein